jgi:hypothetical protein
MGKKVAIVQSNYIPWKGYFDLINSVDEFILFDDVQYTKRDWRNRNIIKTRTGPLWLSIPVLVKGKYFQKICETQVSDQHWKRTHWLSIHQAYSQAPAFSQVKHLLESLYQTSTSDLISEINRHFLSGICEFLGIKTKITSSMGYQITDGKNERLISLCTQAGATDYLAGPSSRSYVDESLFNRAGVSVEFMDYAGYPEYQQLYPPFISTVSIVDLLANEGKKARDFLKTTRKFEGS